MMVFQSLNIIYMDGPVGTGFSYSESLDGYYLDDYEFVAQTHEFLRKVCKKVNTNRIYLARKMLFLIKFYPVINSKIYFIQYAVVGIAPSIFGKSGGDSYSGIPIPMIVQDIVKGNIYGRGSKFS